MSEAKRREQVRIDVDRINAKFKEYAGDERQDLRVSGLAVLLSRMRYDQSGIEPTKEQVFELAEKLKKSAETVREAQRQIDEAKEELFSAYGFQ